MDTLNLKFRLLLLLVTVGTVLGSCAYDDDEKMYSSRSYDDLCIATSLYNRE